MSTLQGFTLDEVAVMDRGHGQQWTAEV